MTAQDIEQLFQEELGIYEFTEDILYSKDTKELYVEFIINFEEDLLKTPNDKLIKALEKNTNINNDFLKDKLSIEKIGTIRFIYKNNSFTYIVNESSLQAVVMKNYIKELIDFIVKKYKII